MANTQTLCRRYAGDVEQLHDCATVLQSILTVSRFRMKKLQTEVGLDSWLRLHWRVSSPEMR